MSPVDLEKKIKNLKKFKFFNRPIMYEHAYIQTYEIIIKSIHIDIVDYVINNGLLDPSPQLHERHLAH